MLWLQTPPWGRWALAALIAGVALWVELRPNPLVEHPFAVTPIAAGEPIDEVNTEMRRVPSGLLEPIESADVALRDIAEGSPIIASEVGLPSSMVPTGWWIVALEVPPGATRGDIVRLVMLDSGTVVDGVVATSGSADAFGSTGGAVAVHPEHAGEVGAAAVDGRVAVLISTS